MIDKVLIVVIIYREKNNIIIECKDLFLDTNNVILSYLHTKINKKDIDCVKELGCNSYRFSIEWSRICPHENKVDFSSLKKYEDMIDLFIPSVHDSSSILTQREALKYIALLTKYKTITYAQEILCDYFLPHLGETNFIKKAYYLGNIVFKLL